MRFLLVPLLMAITAQSAGAQQLAKPGHRKVQLDSGKQVHQEIVRGAPFVLTALVMPEAYSQVTCGNCTQKAGVEVAENWQMTLGREENTIYLKPTRLPSRSHPVAAFRTTLHITLESGYRIAITLELADIRGQEPPDAEVAFQLPGKATLRGRLAEEKAKQDKVFKDQVAAAAQDRLLDVLSGEVTCEDAWGTPYRTDKMVVRVRQSCTAGGKRSRAFWVLFEVQNRGNTQLSLEAAALRPADGGTELTARYRFDTETLRFDERTSGIALTTLDPSAAPPARWELFVGELGGKAREVAVPDLTF